jgi:hypothetical protein
MSTRSREDQCSPKGTARKVRPPAAGQQQERDEGCGPPGVDEHGHGEQDAFVQQEQPAVP